MPDSKRKLPQVPGSADSDAFGTKRRKLSPECGDITSSSEMREMFDRPAVVLEAHCEQTMGPPISTAGLDPVLPPSASLQHCLTHINYPEIQSKDTGARTLLQSSPDKAEGTRCVDANRQQHTVASSSERNAPTENHALSSSLRVPQSEKQEDTGEAPRSTALPANARVSSHAVQPDVSLHSKVIKVFREKDLEAPPSRSSVIRPTPPTASSSKAKTARGKKSAVPEAKKAPAKKAGKPKRELLTPLEYAQRLEEKMADPSNKARGWPYWRGMRIFYYGADRTYASDETRGHMDHVGRLSDCG